MNSTRNHKHETRNGFQTGKIKYFIQQRGFGFIARPGEKDLFVHIKNLRGAGPRELNAGDEVSFELGRDGQERPVALNVRVQLRAKETPATPHTRE